MGAPAGVPSGAAAAAAGLAGGIRPTNAHRGGGGRRAAEPLRGHRWLQADRGAGATGAGHGGSGGVGAERGCGGIAGPLVALLRTGDGAGSGLAVGGVGAALRLRAGRVGPALRPQRELGIAAAGAGGGSAGSGTGAGAAGTDPGAGSHEVPGAGGAPESGRLPADGRHLRPAPLGGARSRPTVRRLAQGLARGPQTASGGAGTVLQNATAAEPASACRTAARSGDGGRNRESRPAATGRRRRLGCPAARKCAAADRSHGTTTSAHGRTTRTGAGNAC
jgi:hypothetical protein